MNVEWLSGFSDYIDIYALQESLVEARIADDSLEDVLLLLEHAPAYTIGRTRDRSSLHESSALPHPVFEINRGGQATYHGPGQLVGYPIVNLNRIARDLHLYVTALESTLVRTCTTFGVEARVREGLVGVWVENRKIASIGVGIRKWISMHGFAINVTEESLPPFSLITPCGIDGVMMTCLEREMGGEFIPVLLHEFGSRFSDFWNESLAQRFYQ